MARVDSQRAIGAVTTLLRDQLLDRGFGVTVGKPEDAAGNDTTAKLNLFLYETVVDASLRNHRLDEAGPDPLWLVLRYLLTAFDDDEHSDSAAAHELLGRGLVALHELNFLGVETTNTSVQLALEHNPEPLKITLEESGPDLIAKLTQGAEETYRLSAAVQVRPVMLLPAEPPASALLVGVDYTTDPPDLTEAPVGVDVTPSLGPVLDRVEPAAFDPGDTFTVLGRDLHLSGLDVLLGDEPLQVVGQRPDRLTVLVASALPGPPEGRLLAAHGPSAGELPLRARLTRPDGRLRASNLLPARLRPVVTGATLDGAGTLVVTGNLLGGETDDVVLTLHADGSVAVALDPATAADQTSLTVTPGPASTVAPPGTYRAIVKVNGAQARSSPTVVVP